MYEIADHYHWSDQQKAADSGGWHPNLALNGKHLDLSVHNGFITKKEHDIYNTRIEVELNNILQDAGGNISPQRAAEELKNLANDIRSQFDMGKKLHEIEITF